MNLKYVAAKAMPISKWVMHWPGPVGVETILNPTADIHVPHNFPFTHSGEHLITAKAYDAMVKTPAAS